MLIVHTRSYNRIGRYSYCVEHESSDEKLDTSVCRESKLLSSVHWRAPHLIPGVTTRYGFRSRRTSICGEHEKSLPFPVNTLALFTHLPFLCLLLLHARNRFARFSSTTSSYQHHSSMAAAKSKLNHIIFKSGRLATLKAPKVQIQAESIGNGWWRGRRAVELAAVVKATFSVTAKL